MPGRSQTRDTSEGSSERRLAQWGGEKSEQIVRRVFYGRVEECKMARTVPSVVLGCAHA